MFAVRPSPLALRPSPPRDASECPGMAIPELFTAMIATRHAAAALTALFLPGCWAPQPPGTLLRINPLTRSVTFHDTKDNRVLVEGLRFNKQNGEGSLDKLEIDNSASTVILQQIQQMHAWNEQMKTANQAIADFTAAATQWTQTIVGAVARSAPQRPAPAAPAGSSTSLNIDTSHSEGGRP